MWHTATLLAGLLLSGWSATAQSTEAPTPHPWYVPDHAVLQTGGGIGMITAGAGYSPGSHPHRFDTDVLVGYVPARYTGHRAFAIFTVKATYSPFSVRLAERWRLLPLSVGGLVNYTPAAQINRNSADKYGYRGYYWWTPTLRAGAFLGSRVALGLPRATGGKREVSLYYELGTNDLYVVSYLPNHKGLSLGQILTLGVGAKVDL